MMTTVKCPSPFPPRFTGWPGLVLTAELCLVAPFLCTAYLDFLLDLGFGVAVFAFFSFGSLGILGAFGVLGSLGSFFSLGSFGSFGSFFAFGLFFFFFSS